MTIEELYALYCQHPLVCTDTRKIEKGCIFFALKGPNFNANTFAAEALAKGAAYAVIDEATDQSKPELLLVDDVLNTLQQLATHHRKELNIPVLAIVGSNGKTTTKELITAVLSEKYKVLATPGNFNNHIGLPLTLLQLNKNHEIAVIEMGANHIGENALLCDIAQPSHGLITNNGKDHLEGFGSIEGVAQSNSELYYYLLKNNGTAFVNANDEWLMRMASRLTQKLTYAGNAGDKHTQADYTGYAQALRPQIVFRMNDSTELIASHLSGDYNFDNMMAAVACGLYFKLTAAEVKRGIEKYIPQNNRSQVIKKEHNTIYLDAYNANPSSMEASLRNFAAMEIPQKIAILGDMFELGIYAEQEHANMIKICRELELSKVLLVGNMFHAQNKETSFFSFETTEEAAAYLSAHPVSGANIFMKGSRGMKLESLSAVIS